MSRVFQPLLFLLAYSTEKHLRKQIEFLKTENEMLRKRVPRKRIFLTGDELNLLIKLGKAIGPGAWHLITIVHPRTYQRWLSDKCDSPPLSDSGGGVNYAARTGVYTASN
jgi:putative transposase